MAARWNHLATNGRGAPGAVRLHSAAVASGTVNHVSSCAIGLGSVVQVVGGAIIDAAATICWYWRARSQQYASLVAIILDVRAAFCLAQCGTLLQRHIRIVRAECLFGTVPSGGAPEVVHGCDVVGPTSPKLRRCQGGLLQVGAAATPIVRQKSLTTWKQAAFSAAVILYCSAIGLLVALSQTRRQGHPPQFVSIVLIAAVREARTLKPWFPTKHTRYTRKAIARSGGGRGSGCGYPMVHTAATTGGDELTTALFQKKAVGVAIKLDRFTVDPVTLIHTGCQSHCSLIDCPVLVPTIAKSLALIVTATLYAVIGVANPSVRA